MIRVSVVYKPTNKLVYEEQTKTGMNTDAYHYQLLKSLQSVEGLIQPVSNLLLKRYEDDSNFDFYFRQWMKLNRLTIDWVNL